MPMEIVTKEDLVAFRGQLLNDFRIIIQDCLKLSTEPIDGYKTSDVRKILNCSVNKLVSLRTARKIRAKKIGGTLYYNKEDVRKLLQEGF